jgi:Fe2+ transport system protein FeoA
MSVALPEKSNLQIPNDSIPLHRLCPGCQARVVAVYGRNHDVSRLAEMGLRSGTIVSVTRGGITSIVQLFNGSRLCVRTSNNLEIFVAPL